MLDSCKCTTSACESVSFVWWCICISTLKKTCACWFCCQHTDGDTDWPPLCPGDSRNPITRHRWLMLLNTNDSSCHQGRAAGTRREKIGASWLSTAADTINIWPHKFILHNVCRQCIMEKPNYAIIITTMAAHPLKMNSFFTYAAQYDDFLLLTAKILPTMWYDLLVLMRFYFYSKLNF